MQKLRDVECTQVLDAPSPKSLAQVWRTLSRERGGAAMEAAWKTTEHLGRGRVVSAKRQMFELYIADGGFVTKRLISDIVHGDEVRRGCRFGKNGSRLRGRSTGDGQLEIQGPTRRTHLRRKVRADREGLVQVIRKLYVGVVSRLLHREKRSRYGCFACGVLHSATHDSCSRPLRAENWQELAILFVQMWFAR